MLHAKDDGRPIKRGRSSDVLTTLTTGEKHCQGLVSSPMFRKTPNYSVPVNGGNLYDKPSSCILHNQDRRGGNGQKIGRRMNDDLSYNGTSVNIAGTSQPDAHVVQLTPDRRRPGVYIILSH